MYIELIMVMFFFIIWVVFLVVWIVLFIFLVIWIEMMLYFLLINCLYILIKELIVGWEFFGNFFEFFIFLIKFVGVNFMWFKYVLLLMLIYKGIILILYFLVFFNVKLIVEFVIILIFVMCLFL